MDPIALSDRSLASHDVKSMLQNACFVFTQRAWGVLIVEHRVRHVAQVDFDKLRRDSLRVRGATVYEH